MGTDVADSNTVLVTGGAGYIGSHAVLALLEAGRKPVVVDDLSTGRRELVPEGVPLIVGDVGDGALMRRVLAEYRCGAVMHFAGSIVVPESVTDPLSYYRNNTCASRSLIEACVAAGVSRFIFSSTAAVYGEPEAVPVAEEAALRPISPYGTSKLMTEWMLRDVAATGALRYVALRYFNVAGADALGRSGQASPKATHLIKVAAEAVTGKREAVTVFGDDYPTPDGTGIRDYIHVSDLAEAHVLALSYLERGAPSDVMNCGYGHGFSVRQVLDAMMAVADRPITLHMGPRRDGDPAELVSNPAKIRRVLAWTPRRDDLREIVASALAWERRLQDAPGAA